MVLTTLDAYGAETASNGQPRCASSAKDGTTRAVFQ